MKLLTDEPKKTTENLVHVGSRLKISPTEIISIEASINYSILELNDGRKVVVATPLKTIEERFSNLSFFIRPNRSTMININFLHSVRNDSITLINGKQHFFSRRRKSKFAYLHAPSSSIPNHYNA